MRQIVLDTETTGLETSDGHRIIEIGCVELLDRKLTNQHFHHYLNPERAVDEGALEIHGLTDDFLKDKPRFEDIAKDFLDYIRGAELIIHNAPFDIGFLNYELNRLGSEWGDISQVATVLDSLTLAREMYPGQRNSLDALCKRYDVNNSQRELHGALLDAEILADVYLAMTGGQTDLLLASDEVSVESKNNTQTEKKQRPPLKVILPDNEELMAHHRWLEVLDKASGECMWRKLEK